MNDEARDQLQKLIATYGPSVCNTPRSCELFVHQYCGQYKAETQALIQALQKGIVTELLKLSKDQWETEFPQLSAELAESAGLSPEDAQWVVDAWGVALGKHPAVAGHVTAAKPKFIVEESQVVGKRVTAASFGARVLLVTIGGAIGGLLGSFAAVLVLLFASIFVADEIDVAQSQPLAPITLITVLGYALLFTVAGSLGALGGAVLVQGQRTSSPHAAATGALMGALFLAAVGTYCHPLLGVIFAMGGAFSGAVGGGYAGR